MTHLTPLREKRDRLAKELIESQPHDEELPGRIDDCLAGNSKEFLAFYYEDECPHCGSCTETWASGKHEEFFEACQRVSQAERDEFFRR